MFGTVHLHGPFGSETKDHSPLQPLRPETLGAFLSLPGKRILRCSRKMAV
jgi:hypothetical protein